MHRRSALRALLVSLVLAPVLALSSVLAVYYDNGSATCSGSRTVVVYSQVSVNIDHYWKSGGHQHWNNPFRALRQSFTPYTSTWWSVEWDFEHTSSGTSCEQ